MTALARFSLSNRALIALATVIAVLAGLWSAMTTKQELIPSLELPVAAVVAPYPGASPDVVEQQVTLPVEQAAGTVQGLESITSTSSGGLSVVTLELAYGTDISTTQQDLQAAVGRISTTLPEDVDPQVITGSIDDLPVVQLAATGEADEDVLVEALRTQVVPELERVEGVRGVTLTGVRDEVVTIDVDLPQLAAAGLSPQTVQTALQANGVVIPAGNLTLGERTLSVEVGDRLTSAEQVAALPLAGEQGPVRLDEVAEVTAAPTEATSLSRTDGRTSFGIGVTKTPDGNTVEVSERVAELLPELEAGLGDGGSLTVVFDQAPFIEQSIEDLTTEGALGLVFAVIVILVFLLSVRSTAVTALSIPLSLLIALIGLRTGGFTLNLFTLAALTVAVGRVVDDSIVVIENINRHLAYGKAKRTAILTGVREVAGAITSSTVATAAVFIPIGVVGGQVGELFRPFAFTVALALLASLFVALTIVPVLAWWFLTPPADARQATTAYDQAQDRERRGLLQRSYLPALRGCLAHPVVTLVVAVGVLGGTLGLATQLKTDFIGDTGQNTLSVTQELPAGTSLEATDQAAQQVEEVVAGLPGLETYQVTIGSGDAAMAAFTGGGGANEATFSITLDLEADAAVAEERLRAGLEGLQDVGELTVSAGMAGLAGELQVVVSAPSGADLEGAARQVRQAVAAVEGTSDVTSNLAASLPTLQVQVDREAAASTGLTEAQVGQSVATALRGSTLGTITTASGPSEVVMRTGERPADVEELEQLTLTGPAGPVPLSAVATVVEVERPTTITRMDGLRSATISATSAADDLGAQTAELESALAELDLPEGVTAQVAGVSADQQEAFTDLGVALAVSIAIVYLIMVATFGSLIQPLILLVSVPFAATGSIGLLLATGTPLGVAALIGALMLVGVVVTNAIVLIDLINQYRRQGQGLREAILEGSRHRLRPILMTAAATIGALTPMALGLTGGSAFISQPLALVVIGGLLTSTLLTLVLVPVLYLLVERVLERQRARRGGDEQDADGMASASA